MHMESIDLSLLVQWLLIPHLYYSSEGWPRPTRSLTILRTNHGVYKFLLPQTDSKVVAERVEAELLSVFDYAWNKGSNGCRRSRDILAKLFMGWPYPNKSRLCRNISSGRRWLCFGTKRVGISIAVQKPRDIHPHIESPRCSWMRRFCLLLSKVRGPHDLASEAGTPHHSRSSTTATARASDRREMVSNF